MEVTVSIPEQFETLIKRSVSRTGENLPELLIGLLGQHLFELERIVIDVPIILSGSFKRYSDESGQALDKLALKLLTKHIQEAGFRPDGPQGIPLLLEDDAEEPR